MSGKQSRRYRALAYAYATKTGVWKKGENDLKAARPWWRKVLDAILPAFTRKHREAESRTVGWWYKRTLKHIARNYAAWLADPDRLALERARKRMARRKV